MNHHRDIKLTGTSFAVLGLVRLLGEASPYDLKAALEASVANFWPVQHTTFYGEPTRLAEAGYLTGEQDQTGRRRKRYRITDRGVQALEQFVASTEFKAPQMRDEQMLKIFLGADPLPLLEARLAWHREKLAELEGYLAAVRESAADAPAPEAGKLASEGVERSLIGGTVYHRVLGDAIADVVQGGVPAADAADRD